MLPILFSLHAGSAAEWLLAALAAATAGALAFAATQWRDEWRIAAGFAGYLAAAIAIGLSLHAVLGETALEIHAFGVMLAIGMLTAWAVLLWTVPPIGGGPRQLFAIVAGSFVCGLVGARLLHVLTAALQGTPADELVAMLLSGRGEGLSVFGGLAGATLWLRGLCAVGTRVPFARVLDAGVPAAALLVAFARVGCLFTGCCPGAPTEFPLALPTDAFAPDSPAAIVGRGHAGLWPNQPVDGLVALVIAIASLVALRLRERWRLRPGTIAASAFIAYALARFGLEFVRGDAPEAIFGALTLWQTITLAAAAFVGVQLARGSR